jgi:uncharacterized membrane protein (DUF4010 family)
MALQATRWSSRRRDFAALFVVISIAATWVRARFGATGVYTLAGIVGLTDIDPFVLSIASGAQSHSPRRQPPPC